MFKGSIAIFTWGLSGGAITNIVAALTRGFTELGVAKIFIIYIKDAPPEQRVDFPPSVESIKLGVKQARWSIFAIAKLLHQIEPDYFISMGFLNIPAILGYLLAGKLKTKLIISQQNSLLYQANVEHRGNWLIESQLWLVPWLYSRVDGLVATTNSVLKELLVELKVNLPPDRTIAIPNLVDIERVALKAQACSEHPWLDRKDRPVIVSIGRLAKQKNFPLLIEAFNIVCQKLDARLIILGRGEEQDRLQAKITQLGLSDKVSFPGFTNNPWSYLAKADLFALSSEEEAFGLVLVEAMACGVPIVATDAMGDGPRSILDNGNYGYLVENHNVDAFAAAMEELLTSSQQRKHFIAAGKERCKIYRPEAIAQQWLDFLMEL